MRNPHLAVAVRTSWPWWSISTARFDIALHDLRPPSRRFTEAWSRRDRHRLRQAYVSITADGTGPHPGQRRTTEQEQEMAAAELQRQADASEDDAAGRYIRQQLLATVIEDAVRRADSMLRLEASLRHQVRTPAA
jgi:hypothetical protein